ncbi:MAG: ATP synthase F1 subunit epsilon [Patescibacteria group bacterium]
MSHLSLKIVTPERLVYEASVDSVTLMTTTGEVTILPGHISLVAPLKAGEMKLKMGNEEEFLAISTGFFEVRAGNEVVVLADTAERLEELELEKIEEAKKRAEALLAEKRFADDRSFADAAASLERELARYKVAQRRRRR